MNIMNLFKGKEERVVLPRTLEGTIFEAVCLVLILIMWTFILVMWRHLPEQIPIHFNAAGDANSYGGRIHLIFIGGIGTFVTVLLLVLAYFPQKVNMLTKPSSAAGYQLVSRLTRIMALLVIGMFYTMIAGMSVSYTHFSDKTFGWAMGIWVVLLFAVVIVFHVKLYRIRHRGEE